MPPKHTGKKKEGESIGHIRFIGQRKIAQLFFKCSGSMGSTGDKKSIELLNQSN